MILSFLSTLHYYHDWYHRGEGSAKTSWNVRRTSRNVLLGQERVASIQSLISITQLIHSNYSYCICVCVCVCVCNFEWTGFHTRYLVRCVCKVFTVSVSSIKKKKSQPKITSCQLFTDTHTHPNRHTDIRTTTTSTTTTSTTTKPRNDINNQIPTPSVS